MDQNLAHGGWTCVSIEKKELWWGDVFSFVSLFDDVMMEFCLRNSRHHSGTTWRSTSITLQCMLLDMKHS